LGTSFNTVIGHFG